MKRNILVLLLVFISSFGVFAQKVRTTAVFDADTSTRPKAGFYGIGIRGNMPFLVKNTGNTIRFGMVSSFGTNYIPKFNSSGSFVNSLAFDNGTNFTIGTNTNIDSYSRLYVFGGANGANIDARPGGGGYDQSIFDAQGSDYATTFRSAHLRYQGAGAVGTTLGFSNANLADLTYNYENADRAFLIRSQGLSPIVFGVNNTQVARLQSTGLHLSNLTTNYLPKHTSGGLDNSSIFDNGTNVGIGTSNPLNKLHVLSASSTAAMIESSASQAFYGLKSNSGGVVYFGNNNGGDFTVQTAGSGYSDKFYITNAGNVGIGTVSPTSKLQVVGLPAYADNAAATSGGLTAGAFYRTSTGVLMVVY